MDFLPLPDSAARQLIDSTTVFAEFLRVQALAKPHAGGMCWKRQGDYEYLVKTRSDGRQSRIGSRSPETEATYEAFTARKHEAEERLRSLRSRTLNA